MRKRDRIAGILSLSAVTALVFLYRFVWTVDGGTALTFCGAAGEVGGSCLLVETGDVRFIVDCGSFGDTGTGVLPPDAENVSFAIVTHAHLDHCGLLPELYTAGFKGKVYCTEPTAELIPVMLKMTRGISRDKVPRDGFERALSGITPVPFDEMIDLGRVSFEFKRAEHLLGAAFVDLSIATPGDRMKIIVSGDLGGGNSLLLRPLARPGEADYMVMESTYGGTVREWNLQEPRDRHEDFAGAVGKALRGGGDVLIPSYALGRTQEVLAAVDLFCREGIIPPGTKVYVDSPTAHKVTEVYRSFAFELSEWAGDFYGGDILKLPNHREVKSRTSLKVHSRRHDSSIFVSTSGDLDYASSPRHLMKMFGDERNLLCIVGWQPPESLGGRILSGQSPVLVRYQSGRSFKKEWISPVLHVESFESFSGHADREGLLEWLSSAGSVRKVFLVHGEPDQAESLSVAIEERFGFGVEIPEAGERFVLN